MIFNDAWKNAFVILGVLVASCFVLLAALFLYSKRLYSKLSRSPSTPLDVDSFVGSPERNEPNYIKLAVMHKLSIGNRKPRNETIELASYESTHVEGLRVTTRSGARPDKTKKEAASKSENATRLHRSPSEPMPIVVGTIRMGFGHHRIAHSACSWALFADEDNKKSSEKEQRTSASDSVPALTSEASSSDKKSSTENTHRAFYPNVINEMKNVTDTADQTSTERNDSSNASSRADAKPERKTYFHDLLSIDSPEADLISSSDELYSKLSRLASNIGGPIEKLWGKATLAGDADALRISAFTAIHLRPLFKDFLTALKGENGDAAVHTPIIASHCYVALAAVAAGFTNVINLVIDNYPQWFVVVPGCLNLVQGPKNYQAFLRMGVDADDVKIAGHWVPRDLVLNITDDCEKRIARAKSGFANANSDVTETKEKNGDKMKPRRILIPVGGAGAQRKFIVNLVRALGPFVKEGKAQLFLNAGDHKHMKKAFISALRDIGFGDEGQYDLITSTEGVRAFQEKLLGGSEPDKPVTLFAFDGEYYPAVAATDILCRVSDVLACKPSELAFYPVPKLMIRRVGDHEQFSALRAAEIGEGTLEARTVESAMDNTTLFVEKPDLLVQMNESIIKNGKSGVYDGCKNAVKIALERYVAATSDEK